MLSESGPWYVSVRQLQGTVSILPIQVATEAYTGRAYSRAVVYCRQRKPIKSHAKYDILYRFRDK